MKEAKNTVNPQEIRHFAKDSAHWWDENGPFKPLHKANPVRLRYIRDQITGHFKISEKLHKPLENMRILDIGCGGGLICEPLSRLGADVTGIDADSQAIAVAQRHADSSGLNIAYHVTPAEKLANDGAYDVVLALEIIEHVENPAEFVSSCARLVRPGGIVIFSTLNRTLKSFAGGIIAAEYLLRWVPAGTHSWKKFVRPSELCAVARKKNLSEKCISGLVYNAIEDKFHLSDKDVSINYFMTFEK